MRETFIKNLSTIIQVVTAVCVVMITLIGWGFTYGKVTEQNLETRTLTLKNASEIADNRTAIASQQNQIVEVRVIATGAKEIANEAKDGVRRLWESLTAAKKTGGTQ